MKKPRSFKKMVVSIGRIYEILVSEVDCKVPVLRKNNFVKIISVVEAGIQSDLGE